ncbi:hypothetical protein GCM10009808_14810 [Microbacterium sediminicola]|uniref:DUF3027 domain-containing protein n=1 Tax=Microbacterium sediminicola TaxID=415210 RepID=A0ABP4U766_9MICO
MTSTPDPALLEAHDLARAALCEITPEHTIGDPVGYTVEDEGVVSLRFATTLRGYPGWFWTVTLARVGEAEPTVLEAELLPGEDALLAPEWVPWAERLAEYQAAQAAAALAAEDEESDDADAADEDDLDADEDDDDEDLDDVDDLDATDFDVDGSPILHAGDVDGVDIDDLDESEADDEPAEDADADEGDVEDTDDSDDEDDTHDGDVAD